MKSSIRFQNGNSGVNFDNNSGDSARMNNLSTLSGVADGTSSASLINQAKAINSGQQDQRVWPSSQNGFVNGNNNKTATATATTTTALNQAKPYQRKFSGNGLDVDFDDDEKTNSFGLSRRVGGLSTLKNASSNELRIDEKNISLHLNNPFVTHYAVSSSSLSLSSASNEHVAFNRSVDRSFYGTSSNTIINSSGNNTSTAGMPQSASTSQLSNVIKSQQLKNYSASGSNENGSSDYGRINDIDNNTLRSRPKRPHSIAGILSPALLASSSGSCVSRLSALNQSKDELTSLITAAATTSRAATTTMTYSNSYVAPNNNKPASNNSAMKSSMSTLNNVNNGNQNAQAQKVFNQPQNNEYAQQASTHVSYGHFINSPSRLTTNRQPASQEFSLYSPPSATTTIANVSSINNGTNNNTPPAVQARQPPPIVQRRSHSTPRSIQSTVSMSISTDNANKSTPSTVNNNNSSSGVVIRPRSLDRTR